MSLMTFEEVAEELSRMGPVRVHDARNAWEVAKGQHARDVEAVRTIPVSELASGAWVARTGEQFGSVIAEAVRARIILALTSPAPGAGAYDE